VNADVVAATALGSFSASTGDSESLRSRASSWSRIADPVFGRHDTNLLRHADPFHGTLRYRRIGDYALSDVRTGPHELLHGGPTARHTQGVLHLNLILHGGCERFQQAGRDAPLAPGDLVVDDGDEPYSMRIPHEFHCLTLHFPKSKVPPLMGRPESIVAIRVPAELSEAASLRSLMTSIAPEHRAGTSAGQMLADAAVTVVAAAVLRLGGMEQGEGAREAHLRRAKAFIESRLWDAALGPGTVAAAVHVSLRHLHAVFEIEGETVGSYIMTRRLESARALLGDIQGRHLPVAEVGYRHGFRDPSHFGRAFARRFGISPARYRAEAMGPDAG